MKFTVDGQRRAYSNPAKKKWYAQQRAKRYARYIAKLANQLKKR